MRHSSALKLLFLPMASIPFFLVSCSIPEIKFISCKNTSIVSQFEDGSNVLTPQNVLGKEDFTWFKDDNKVEVKVLGSFDADGKYKEATQKVPALLRKDILSFKTKSSHILSGKSFEINLTSKTYSSSDLKWQSSPDRSFKIITKGTCIL